MVVLLLAISAVALGNVIASFKEVAGDGGVILLARCRPAPEGNVTCTGLESWRGVAPKSPIIIKHLGWASDPVSGLEKDPAVLFLMALDEQGQPFCMSLAILSDRPACVLPIIKQQLPVNFRWFYDHTHGTALSLQDLKSDLIPSSGAGPRR
jgi:hypothetical protein